MQLHELATRINSVVESDERATLQNALRAGGALLGILEQNPTTWLQGDAADEKEAIEARIMQRQKAREERRFADADRIRAELAAEGITLEDKPDGRTEWRRG